jgi:adenylate kinase
MLGDEGVALDLVLELVVEFDEVIRRLSGRRSCHGCDKVWHVEFDRPTKEGVCDNCGGELYQRDDDKPETITERLRVYERDTAPLVDYYGAQGKLVGIDATGPVEDVTTRAMDALRPFGA